MLIYNRIPSKTSRKMIEYICPYLGTNRDSNTAMAFASSENYCFRSKMSLKIDLTQQDEYCLNKAYLQCPIFLLKVNQDLNTLNPQTLYQPAKSSTNYSKKRNIAIIILVMLFLLVLLVMTQTLLQNKTSINLNYYHLFNAGTADTALQNHDSGKSISLSTSISSLNSLPNHTPSPNGFKNLRQYFTPTVCLAPDGWIKTIVQPGETLNSISAKYKIHKDQLKTANCLQNFETLISGSILFVPPIQTSDYSPYSTATSQPSPTTLSKQ
jgi:LysM repeat protein